MNPSIPNVTLSIGEIIIPRSFPCFMLDGDVGKSRLIFCIGVDVDMLTNSTGFDFTLNMSGTDLELFVKKYAFN